jgi:putative tRNA adenosine deaminase-associated protein
VAYFAAILARSADRWSARDADLDDIEDLADLADFMRRAWADEDEEPETGLLLLEQEDVWFAVVRIDVEEDPRLFVSDAAAVSRSAHADLLLAEALAPIGPDGGVLGGQAALEDGPDAVSDEDDEDEEETEEGAEPLAFVQPEEAAGLGASGRKPPPAGPAGDPELLSDLGVTAPKLTQLCLGGMLPADAIAELAEALGAADELEEVR